MWGRRGASGKQSLNPMAVEDLRALGAWVLSRRTLESLRTNRVGGLLGRALPEAPVPTRSSHSHTCPPQGSHPPALPLHPWVPLLSPLCLPRPSQNLPPVHACLPVRPSPHHSVHPITLSLLFTSTGPTLSIRSWGLGGHGFHIPNHYHPEHVPPPLQPWIPSRPTERQTSHKAISQAKADLVWPARPEQCPHSYHVQKSLWHPPNCWVWSVQGPRWRMWTASVLPCLCRPCSVRDRHAQGVRKPTKSAPCMQVN